MKAGEELQVSLTSPLIMQVAMQEVGPWQHLAAVMESGESAMALSASPVRMSVSWLSMPGGV